MHKEKSLPGVSGLPVLVGVLLMWGATSWTTFVSSTAMDPQRSLLWLGAAAALGFFLLKGLFIVQPNEAKVLQLFGAYSGTAKEPGLRWANPFYVAVKVSCRTRNFETNKSKVNDANGNPIEIAAVVVWQVRDTAEAVFDVDNYEHFVHVQSESALRQLASEYPYDADDGQESLRAKAQTIADHLKDEIQDRLKHAGVKVMEARFSHLAYAPEIASAMLQRQQASAVVAARRLIVEGAVGMVEDALARLAEKNVVQLDHASKAQMVSNLLVVLCGERGAQPVVNAGSTH